MTTEQHRQQHEGWHKSLDLLTADYTTHHPEKKLQEILSMPLIELIKWSFKQTQNPTEL